MKLWLVLCLAFAACSVAMAAEGVMWWNPKWRFRTTVTRPTPYRDAAPRPIEVAVDFPLLLKQAGISGEFDSNSVRVIERGGGEAPSACRTEFDARRNRAQGYVAWMTQPKIGHVGVADIYFDTKDRNIGSPNYDATLLPPVNLLTNPTFDEEAKGLPAGWEASPAELIRLDRFKHTTGQRSVKIVVDEKTPEKAGRIAVISQKIDVRKFAGQEVVFECDLLAERAVYGAPVTVELQQFRGNGSQVLECAIQPRWLTLELAPGQLVQFCERGKFSPEAATANVVLRVRCCVQDADTGQNVTGPESFFTVWADRMVVRPGERWPWPAATNAGFVEGALKNAPLNRGFEFTGQRRIAFNGASEGTLTANVYNPDPKSVHWGPLAGTVEFWCKPKWNADDNAEHVFFDSVAYMHRTQCRLRKRDAGGKNELEFTIGDADANTHTVRSPAPLKAGQWQHIAATWDFAKAHVQLFVDGKLIAREGPGTTPWPSSAVAKGEEKLKGLGVTEDDKRSVPMQAFIGGDKDSAERRAAEAVMDEFRVSDIVRYAGDFTPLQEELLVDEHTRGLWHLDNERHGVHDSDDRHARGMLGCELPPQEEKVPLDVFADGRIDPRMVMVQPHPTQEVFEKNRAENRLRATRPFLKLPDPRFVEYRERQIERTVTGKGEEFSISVAGDYEPLMRSETFQRAEGAPAQTTLLPRWRANENVVPFSVESIAATLAANVAGDVEKAFLAFKYSTDVTNYYDAHYAETLPCGRHRPRVSYVLTKGINIYPFDQCGPLNHVLRKLFLCVGISSNNASGTHHQFEQAFYQGDWRLFDLSSRIFWLNRDNTTVVGRRGMEDDTYLKLRQGGNVNAWIPGRKCQATFGTAMRPHCMDFPLRPGERASVCWHNEGRWFEVTDEDRKPIPLAKIPPYFGNGAIVYEPTAEGEATVLDNMAVEASVLRAKDAGKPANFIYRAECPYIFSDLHVRGEYKAKEAGAIRLSLSFDQGKTWNEVWRNADKAGTLAVNPSREVMGRYAYWLKIDLSPNSEATVGGLNVRTTFVVSPLSLPGKLRKGDNRITFVGGPATVPIKTTCSWFERHKSDLGVSLNAISYYMNDDEAHRNVFVVAPGGEAPIKVTLQGKALRGEVLLEGLPKGWTGAPEKKPVELADVTKTAEAEFVMRAGEGVEGEIRTVDVVVREGDHQRRIGAQVLAARAALVREAELADEIAGEVKVADLPEASGAKIMAFSGEGKLCFDMAVPAEGRYALWLRARWEKDSNTRMTLSIDDAKARNLRAAAMIGFTDWTSAIEANTKMFAHYGEAYAHWSWYRIPDVQVAAGKHRLTIGAMPGACFDALLLLPQNPVMDRAAMNLFQNWNYAPWQNPL